MSDGEDFELDSDQSFGFTEKENDAAWMTVHVVIQIAILIVAHVHKSALFVLFALFSQVKGRALNFALCMPSKSLKWAKTDYGNAGSHAARLHQGQGPH